MLSRRKTGTLSGRGSVHDALRDLLQRAAELTPAHSQRCLQLAAVLGEQNRWEEAEELLQRVVEADPDNLDVRVNLAHALVQCGRLEEAAETYRHIFAHGPIMPRSTAASASCANNKDGLRKRWPPSNARSSCGPTIPTPSTTWASCCGRCTASTRPAARSRKRWCSHRFRAGRIQSRHDPALVRRLLRGLERLSATCLPREGAGFRVGSARMGWTSDARQTPAGLCGQGFGDTIQFARFLSRCRDRSEARTAFCCQPQLAGIFEGLAGVDELLTYGTALPKCDFQVPLASVPGLLGVTVESVAAGTPYLPRPRNSGPSWPTCWAAVGPAHCAGRRLAGKPAADARWRPLVSARKAPASFGDRRGEFLQPANGRIWPPTDRRASP